MLTIHLLPASYGDTILVDICTNPDKPETNTLLLVDCSFNYEKYILPLLTKCNKDGKKIDRFIVTHLDNDHLKTAARLIKENGNATDPQIIKIDQVWHNSYRHLQFKKRKLVETDKDNELQLKNFIATQNPEDQNGTTISADQAMIVGEELYTGKYNWNKDFDEKAVCIEHKKIIQINDDVTLRLLGPTQTQLEYLEADFKDALEDRNIKESDSKLLDDAFELYRRTQEKNQDPSYTGPVSGAGIGKLTASKLKALANDDSYKPDKRIGNGSSISFVVEFGKKRFLMLADAHAEPVMAELTAAYPDEDPIFFDAVKVSHHGSVGNNPKKLYDLIESPIYFISTNGKHQTHKHPDIETVANIVTRPLRNGVVKRKVVFNYNPEHLADIFDQGLMDELDYSAVVSNIEEIQ